MKRLTLGFILCFISFFGGLGATSFINVTQIKGGGTGTFVLQSINGINSWIAQGTNPQNNFADAEVPSGTITGSNPTFTLTHTPFGTSLELVRNDVVQQAVVDFTLTGSTITFVTNAIPQVGDSIQAWYRY